MAKKNGTNAKAKAHNKEQRLKMWNKGYMQGIEIGLLASYMTLVDNFNFNQDKIEKFNYNFQKSALYILSETLTRADIEKVLKDKGVDLSIVGDSNIERIEKLRDAVFGRTEISDSKPLRKYVEHMSRYDIPASPDCTECHTYKCDICPRLEPYADVVESAIREIEAKEKK